MFFCNGVDNTEPYIRGAASCVQETWADHPGENAWRILSMIDVAFR